MTPYDKLIDNLCEDNSVFNYTIHKAGGSLYNPVLQVEIKWADARDKQCKVDMIPLPASEVYARFQECKREHHWKNYREHLVYKKEETFGTDLNSKWFVDDYAIEGKRVDPRGIHPCRDNRFSVNKISVRITEKCSSIPWITKVTEGEGLRETFPPVEDFKTKEIWLKYVKKWLSE